MKKVKRLNDLDPVILERMLLLHAKIDMAVAYLIQGEEEIVAKNLSDLVRNTVELASYLNITLPDVIEGEQYDFTNRSTEQMS